VHGFECYLDTSYPVLHLYTTTNTCWSSFYDKY
jgi:hypothetical protein